jgi:hypothetical protein
MEHEHVWRLFGAWDDAPSANATAVIPLDAMSLHP